MTMHLNPGRRSVLAGLGSGGLLLAAGCSLPGSEPAPRLFVLSPKSTFPPDLPGTNVQLVIDEPFAASGLATARIALAPDPFGLAYFADAAWTERAPAMIQTLLVESFENSGRIPAIARESVDLRPDYILKTELREFQAMLRGENAPPDVLVQINAKIVVLPQRLIYANNTFESVERAAARDIESVVRAFDAALGTVLKDLVEWTLRTLPSTGAPPSSS